MEQFSYDLNGILEVDTTIHPRDTLPNVTAIARAEAVLIDLVGPERARLLECLNAFRVALESQDPKQSQVLREVLVGLTAALRRGDDG